MESMMSTVVDTVKQIYPLKTPSKVIIVRAIICMIYFGFGLIMVTQVN